MNAKIQQILVFFVIVGLLAACGGQQPATPAATAARCS